MNIVMQDACVPFINDYFFFNSSELYVSCNKTWCTKMVDQIIELDELPSDAFLKTLWSLSIVIMVIQVPVHNYLQLLNILPQLLAVFKWFEKEYSCFSFPEVVKESGLFCVCIQLSKYVEICICMKGFFCPEEVLFLQKTVGRDLDILAF